MGSGEVLEMPPEIQAAIDRKATALALEAYDLIREHLRRRAAYEATVGGVKMTIDAQRAKRAVERGNPGEALAYAYHSELQSLRVRAEFFLSGAQSFMASLSAGPSLAT